MRNITKLASLLDRAGNFILADKLDKIAQNFQENPQAKYKKAIEEYKEALSNEAENSQNIIIDFNNWCDSMYNQTNDKNNKKYYQQLKYNFSKHAERLKIFDIPGNRFYADNSLIRNIKDFGLETATDVDDFNARWKQFTDFSKRRRFNNYPTNSAYIYKQPGVQEQLALLYDQLKSKYTNPVKYKYQQPTKNVNDSIKWTIGSGGPELSIPDEYS